MNSMEKKNQKISKATMSRFPVYLKALRNMQHAGKENFLYSEISEITDRLYITLLRECGYLKKKD